MQMKSEDEAGRYWWEVPQEIRKCYEKSGNVRKRRNVTKNDKKSHVTTSLDKRH